jgi:hypothetical protein
MTDHNLANKGGYLSDNSSIVHKILKFQKYGGMKGCELGFGF